MVPPSGWGIKSEPARHLRGRVIARGDRVCAPARPDGLMRRATPPIDHSERSTAPLDAAASGYGPKPSLRAIIGPAIPAALAGVGSQPSFSRRRWQRGIGAPLKAGSRPTIAYEDGLPQGLSTKSLADSHARTEMVPRSSNSTEAPRPSSNANAILPVARIGVRQSSGLIVFAPFLPVSRRLDPAERGGPDIDCSWIERPAALLG